jgi:hypothetical protein
MVLTSFLRYNGSRSDTLKAIGGIGYGKNQGCSVSSGRKMGIEIAQ